MAPATQTHLTQKWLARKYHSLAFWQQERHHEGQAYGQRSAHNGQQDKSKWLCPGCGRANNLQKLVMVGEWGAQDVNRCALKGSRGAAFPCIVEGAVLLQMKGGRAGAGEGTCLST